MGHGALPTISPAEAERRRRAEPPEPGAGTVLVDVREPAEFAWLRAEDVVLLPVSRFIPTYGSLPRDRPLAIICQSGGRSAQVTAFLLAHGWTDVVNVEGGMSAWERAGLPVRRGTPEPGEGDLPAV